MSKLLTLSIYEMEKKIAKELPEEDFQLSPDEVTKILQELAEGISILEKLGREPSSKVLQQKKTL